MYIDAHTGHFKYTCLCGFAAHKNFNGYAQLQRLA